jgi:hypothetical protein
MTEEQAAEKIDEIVLDFIACCGTKKAAAIRLGSDEGDFNRKISDPKAGWKRSELAKMMADSGYTLVRNDVYKAVVVMSGIGQKAIAQEVDEL